MPTAPAIRIRDRRTPSLTGAGRVVLFVVLALASLSLTAAARSSSGPALLQQYCFDCHADGARKGEVELDAWLKASPSAESAAHWQKAWKITRHEFMPPAGRAQPSPEERESIVRWIASEKLGVDFERPDPGRVTLRRLNRLEYEFSIQDLFGADLASESSFSSDVSNASTTRQRLRDRLPPDETAHGFDNIGDFLTLPPALLDRYFEIAEDVVSRVVSLDGPRPPEQKFQPGDFAKAASSTEKVHAQTLSVETHHAGSYRVEIQFTVGGWQEYGGAYDMAVRMSETVLGQDRIDIGGYKTHRYATNLHLSAGRHTILLSTEPKVPDFKGALKALALRPAARLVGPLEQRHLTYPEPHQRVFFKGEPPRETRKRRAYARDILERAASRAFRRPVETATLDGLVSVALQEPHFERGIAHGLIAILTSPQFLFRSETQPRPNDPSTVHALDDYALASRLSYLLWLSVPDDELTRLAAQGRLRPQLRAQVKRMLADAKAERFFEDFPGQWLRTRNVLMTPVSMRAGAKLDPVRASMKRETELLFEHIARRDLDLIELLTARYTFLDKPLADYYGIPGVPEQGFHRVELAPESRRGGLLTQGSFLVSSSNPNRTSPVKRGLFVLENLLALEPPPPPPNVPALEDVNLGDTSKISGRERLALHRADKSCASCHAHFDPLGVALENFDVLGQWRDRDEGLPIEARENTLSGETLTGVADVRTFLTGQKRRFYRGVSEKLLTYALGRGLDPADAVTVDRLAVDLDANGGTFSTLLMGVVESPAFQMRRGDDGGTRSATRGFVPSPPPPEKRRPPKRS